MKLTIILVHNSYQQPGGEDVVFEQERQLLGRAGHAVVTFRRSNHEIHDLSTVGKLTLVKQTIWAGDARRDFSKLLRQEKPQLVHVHNTFPMVSPSIYWACREAHVPVVQTLHNYRLLCPAANLFRDGKVCEECVDHGLWRSVRHGCYRGSRVATGTSALMLAVHRRLGTWNRMVDTYIAVSEFARQKFISAGLPPEKVCVKPNFVHPDPGPGEEKDEYALFVGRLSEEKGLKTLLAAWQQLPRPIPLVIVGDGPMRAELEAEAAACGISAVQFRGRLERAQTASMTKRARFLILPSECYENFPLIIVEAFACGTPVLCSRLGAMQEITEEGRTGLQFTPADPCDLAAKVEWAWAHPKRMDEMGKAARLEYETKYTAEKNYQYLMEIYRRALSLRGQAPEAVPSLAPA